MTSSSANRQRSASRVAWSWCLFDFANSAFNTVIITFVYVTFFTDEAVGLAPGARGESLWAYSVAAAGVLIAVLSPLLGAYTDRTRTRRRALVVCTWVSIVATALLFFPSTPDDSNAILTALVLVTVANVAFELAFALYNAFLPSIGNRCSVGRISGYGWALGYVGGLLCLVLSFVMLGWLAPADPETASVSARSLPVRATCLLVAAWFAVFSLPMFLFVAEPDTERVSGSGTRAWRHVLHTLGELRSYPDLLRLFVARLCYNDGIMAIINLAALYMSQTLGMASSEVIPVAIWLNVAAALGALGFGRLDDRIGGKPVVVWSLALVLGGTVLAFAVPTVPSFWVAATLIGIGLGPNQSASRTLVARMVAPSRSAEFYGLFALSGKATVWLGPTLFALIRPHFEDQRVAFMPIVALLVVGLVLVLPLDEQRGVARANTEHSSG